jgi:alkanesulfonate monooxygenase SsuD/methylene tetrahydromethanopterin reductase-like flavin-dependent oxidoreductase (luciferase family)
MQFCLEVWGTSYEDIRKTCIEAENLGYYGFYYGESLAEIDMDCWTTIANIATITSKIKLGPVITYPFPQYRSIALLAKNALTFQEISKGRLEFRTGAGATLQYASQWWDPFGIPYPKINERVNILEEGLQILQKFWSGKPVFFDGKYFKINGGTMKKTNKTIPITVAAKGDKMMAIAAKYANVWEVSYISPEKFSLLNEKFREICDNAERKDSSNIIRSIELDVIIAKSESELDYKKKLFMMDRGPGVYNQILQNGLVGTPEKVSERIKEYLDAGVEQFFLAFQDPFSVPDLELFSDSIRS